jgi:hypothetical protein
LYNRKVLYLYTHTLPPTIHPPRIMLPSVMKIVLLLPLLATDVLGRLTTRDRIDSDALVSNLYERDVYEEYLYARAVIRARSEFGLGPGFPYDIQRRDLSHLDRRVPVKGYDPNEPTRMEQKERLLNEYVQAERPKYDKALNDAADRAAAIEKNADKTGKLSKSQPRPKNLNAN